MAPQKTNTEPEEVSLPGRRPRARKAWRAPNGEHDVGRFRTSDDEKTKVSMTSCQGGVVTDGSST